MGRWIHFAYSPNQFDAIALIYALPGRNQISHPQIAGKVITPGGTVIFEAFSKKHLAYNSSDEKIGGPKDLASLFSIEEIQHDFSGFHFSELAETEIELHEGLYHNGKGFRDPVCGKETLNNQPTSLLHCVYGYHKPCNQL